MRREPHVRFYEGGGVKLPSATRPIEIRGQRIRLYGIDSPESAQLCQAGQKPYRCGQQAALALADRIGERTVHCQERDTDRYGRVVAMPAAKISTAGWSSRAGQWPSASIPSTTWTPRTMRERPDAGSGKASSKCHGTGERRVANLDPASLSSGCCRHHVCFRAKRALAPASERRKAT